MIVRVSDALGDSLVSWNGTSPRVWDEKHLRFATDAAGVSLWSWNVDTDQIALDEQAHRLWGVPKRGSVTFEELSARIHPADLDRVRAAFQETRTVLGPFDIDFRILEGAATRWIAARGRGDDVGIVGRVMFGVFLDITERKRAEELNELLAREMSHRVKNIFALMAALTRISSSSTTSRDEMTQDLGNRIMSLSHAHDLVRPASGQTEERPAPLDDLISALLEPYKDKNNDRFRFDIPPILVSSQSITSLALIVHELATNSVKYGALSVVGGKVEVSCDSDDSEVLVMWRERGGPSIEKRPEREGFGSFMVAQSISGQLGGSLKSEWPEEGVTIWLTMDKTRLTE